MWVDKKMKASQHRQISGSVSTSRNTCLFAYAIPGMIRPDVVGVCASCSFRILVRLPMAKTAQEKFIEVLEFVFPEREI